MTPESSSDSEQRTAISTSRSLISLLIFAHFFFVFVAVAGNLAPSELQLRILARFAFHTRLFNFDLNATPFHLTHATLEDVDHRIEVLPEGADVADSDRWIVLPDVGVRGSDRYQRYQRLARVMSFFAEEEEVPALLAQATGASFLRQRGTRPKQIRCRKHMLQRWDVIRGGTPAQRDANSPEYFQVAYDARCVLSGDSVGVVKLAEASQAAQPAAEGDATHASDP